MKIPQITILGLTLIASTAFGQELTYTFKSHIGEKIYVTKITDKSYSKDLDQNIYVEVDGEVEKIRKSIPFTKVAQLAIVQAKKLLGDEYAKSWAMKEIGLKSDSYKGKNFHYFYVSFRPIKKLEAEVKGDLRVIMTLDGHVFPLVEKK